MTVVHDDDDDTNEYQRAQWSWKVRMGQLKKHMVGGVLIPTARTALAVVGLGHHHRMIRVEICSTAGSKTSKCDKIEDNEWELRDDEAIFLRVFRLPGKEQDDHHEDEHNGDDEHAPPVGKERHRYTLEEVQILHAHKNVYEVKLGTGQEVVVRDIHFASEQEAIDFQTIWDRMVNMSQERTQRQIGRFAEKQRSDATLKDKHSKSPPHETKTRALPTLTEGEPTDEGDETMENIELLVEIVGATNLPVADLTSTDPYVVVRMGGKVIHRTKVIVSDLDPIWTLQTGSLFLLQMTPQEFFSATGGMLFTIKDSDTIGAHDILGKVSVSLNDLLEGKGKRIEYKVQMDEKMAKAVKKKKEDTNLYLRIKPASESDKEFMQVFEANPKALGWYIDETYLPLRPPASKLLKGQRKKDHGTTLYRVKPFPDPEREEGTKWMTEKQIELESKKPSTHWVEAGSGEQGKVYFELIGCDGLPNADAMTLNPRDKTDAFGCIIFEDCIVNTDVVANTLSPRWPPWCRRAFAFNIFQPTSDIHLAIFDYDDELSPTQLVTRVAASDLHDPIGRVRINLSKLAPGTTYNLKYSLYYGETEEARKKTRGTVHVRIRLEFFDVRKAMISGLIPQGSSYVSVAKQTDFEVADYTAEGIVDERDFSMIVFTKYIAELQAYKYLVEYIAEAALTVWLWRGHYKVQMVGKKAKLPLHSLVAYVWAILITWNFNLLPSFLLFAVAWFLLATNEYVKRHPSRWKSSLGYFSLLRLFLLNSMPPQNVPQNHRFQEIQEYEENEKQMAEKAKLRRQREAKLQAEVISETIDAMDKEDVNIASKDKKLMDIPGVVNVNPLKPILHPVQKKLRVLVSYLRIAKTVVLWEETYYSFWLVTFAFAASAGCVFVPWAFILRWSLRLAAWLLLGPWMMLVDKHYFQKLATVDEDSDDVIRARIKARYSYVLDSKAHARIKRENKLKLQAIKRFCFGKFLVENEVFNDDLYWDTPLPESSAIPCIDSPSINIAERRFGQQLMGDMIPKREVQVSGNKKGHSKYLIPNSFIRKGLKAPPKQAMEVGKGVGKGLGRGLDKGLGGLGKGVDTLFKIMPFSNRPRATETSPLLATEKEKTKSEYESVDEAREKQN